MKLWNVEIIVTKRIVVAAENEEDARHIGYGHETTDDFSDRTLDAADVETHAKVIMFKAELPEGWDEKCLPYGPADDKTIGEHLNEIIR